MRIFSLLQKERFLVPIIAVLLTSFNFNLSAQLNQEQLDQYISKNVKDYDIAGLSIAIVKDGKIDFQKAYG